MKERGKGGVRKRNRACRGSEEELRYWLFCFLSFTHFFYFFLFSFFCNRCKKGQLCVGVSASMLEELLPNDTTNGPRALDNHSRRLSV